MKQKKISPRDKLLLPFLFGLLFKSAGIFAQFTPIDYKIQSVVPSIILKKVNNTAWNFKWIITPLKNSTRFWLEGRLSIDAGTHVTVLNRINNTQRSLSFESYFNTPKIDSILINQCIFQKSEFEFKPTSVQTKKIVVDRPEIINYGKTNLTRIRVSYVPTFSEDTITTEGFVLLYLQNVGIVSTYNFELYKRLCSQFETLWNFTGNKRYLTFLLQKDKRAVYVGQNVTRK